MNIPDIRFPAEWEPQAAILLSWPHVNTDWAYMLSDVQICFQHIAAEIVHNGEKLIIVAPDTSLIKERLAKICDIHSIRFFDIDTNDTWARDTLAITTLCSGKPVINDFKFNGWGLKFAADRDNLITHRLYHTEHLFNGQYNNMLNFVLEGGSVESNGKGTLLTTSRCLLSQNRNGGYDKCQIECTLKKTLGVKQILWIDYGFLEGDDTDSHIDTLARFAPNDTILYVGTNNTQDSHFHQLQAMEQQLQSFVLPDGTKFNLVRLPMPDPVYDSERNRLPATYANFLIANGFILVPTYRQPQNDTKALAVIQSVFNGYKIIGIDCTPLVQQHGSLHCVTMQFPENSINEI